MNLKRAFIVLGALLLGAGFFGAAPAQAAITCHPITNSTMTWPYNGVNQYCDGGTHGSGATAANGSTMVSSLNNAKTIAPDLGAKLAAANAPFLLFHTPADYNDYRVQQGGSPVTISNDASAITIYTGTGTGTTPIMTALFEQTGGGVDIHNEITNSVVHESGHWADVFYRTKVGSTTFRSSGSVLFGNDLSRDWTLFIALSGQCSTTANVFTGRQDEGGAKWICSSNQTATVGGTVHAGDKLKITITDAALSPNPDFVEYIVVAGDTTTSIATGLKNLINANANMTGKGITATSSSTVVTINSKTGNSTTYAKTITGTETLNLPAPSYGHGGSLGNAYSGDNKAVLQASHPYIFSNPNLHELFAEEVAVETGTLDTGPAANDAYFINDDFLCTRTLVRSLIKYGDKPATGASPIPWPTGRMCPTS